MTSDAPEPETAEPPPVTAEPPPVTEDIQVVGAVLCDDLERPTRFLAARRSYPPELAGLWQFPGGKVDPGESPEQALLREVVEELEVEARLGAQIVGPEPGGGWRTGPEHVMSVWWCVAARGEPRALGSHDAVVWVGRGDALALPWLPGDLPIVERVVAGLE